MSINYHSYILKGIESSLVDYAVELVQIRITDPASFKKFMRYLDDYTVDGIICIEFFDTEYIEKLSATGKPLVFMDFPVNSFTLKGHYDLILPENMNTIQNFCLHLIPQKGCRTFGFVGDYLHCTSFYERFTGMREAMFLAGLPVDLRYSITYSDTKPYDTAALEEALDSLPGLPDCFVAANDSIAINLINALNTMNVKIPDEVKIIGYDNIPDSKRTEPPLTSVNVNKMAIGRRIVSLLFERLANPSQSNQIIHITSSIVPRSST